MVEMYFPLENFRVRIKKNRFSIHIGGPNSDHCKAKKKYEYLMRQSQSIQAALDKQSSQAKIEYRIRLTAYIKVVRFFLDKGMAFRGHDKSVSSSNKGNFLKLLRYHTKICDKDVAMILRKGPKNNQLTFSIVQKEIIRACTLEIAKAIIKDLNDDYFNILVDESHDISYKKQMALVLRYVDRRGFVMERFIRILHVCDTIAISLKEKITSLLAQHSLNISYIRGQCYDGAKNRSVHSVHCFSHQLQLTFVGISKKCDEVAGVVNLVLAMLNVVGASFKHRDALQDAQILKIQKALEIAELQTGRGLNQELGLARPSDTLFCIKHDIEIPRFDSFYLQELDNRFNEVTSDLLHGMACLSPSQSFANFDIEKIMRLVALYPDGFKEYDLVELHHQIENYIVDICSEDIRFIGLNGIGDLSKKLVEIKKPLVYFHVCRLLKFSLLLSIATASVERAFSAIKFIKTDLWNRMEDDFLNDCLITYKKRDVFMSISDDDIITIFQNMNTCRGQLD
ncbi:hypothetical protein CDL12_26941 [Handroanthus impetiginosus]|uniref:DUF4371 domain-containing protein n=1 Tax=Handroanthus impetiginosus TaxID=429701 RepID=A0A2G9G5F2_9LAMI|nr:hypothetical protein CDL12_26941 [Handroanthus impetiginosus]